MKLVTAAFTLLIICSSAVLSAQTNYSGKEFHLTLGGMSSGSISARYCNDGRVILTSKHLATVTFHYNFTNQSDVFTVQPGIPSQIYLDTAKTRWISNDLVEQVNRKSLYITSDSNITVQFNNDRTIANEDAMTIFPSDNQDYASEYYLLGLTGGSSYGVYAFSLVANCDSVELEITPSINTYAHPANMPFMVTLHKGDSYELGTPVAQGISKKDLSGTRIRIISASCCFPINLLTTYPTVYSKYPMDTSRFFCCADQIMEQLIPVDWWSNEYAIMPFYANPKSMIRIVSASNSNTVRFDNTIVCSLNRGQVWDTVITAPTVITADSVIGIAHFMLSDQYDTTPGNGDPSMLWCIPMSRGVKQGYLPLFRPFQSNSRDTHFVSIVCNTSDVPTVMLDGNPIATQFQPFPLNSNYQFAHIRLDTMINHYLSAAHPITAWYGAIYVQGSYLLPVADPVSTASQSADTVRQTIRICGDTVITLSGSGNAQSFQWSTGASTAQITVTGAGVYTLTETTSCPPSAKHYIFSVTQQGWLGRFRDTVLCQGDSFQLQATADTGLTILWQPSIGLSDSTIADPLIRPDTTTAYTVRVQRPGCPDIINHFTVHVEPVPSVHLGNDTIMCEGDTISLHPLVLPQWYTSYTYRWVPASAIVPLTPPNALYTIQDSATLSLQVRTPAGCSGTDTLHIAFALRPSLTVSPDFVARYGEVVQLKAEGARFYTWTPTRLLDYPNEPTPKATATQPEQFQVIGLNEYGCRDTGYVKMDINYTMVDFLPSAFSPNGDGRNDIFRIGGLKYQRLLEFRIFNRWGQQVFTTLNQTQGWDGTFNGIPQEIGVYHYIIRLAYPDGQLKLYKGDVTLVR